MLAVSCVVIMLTTSIQASQLVTTRSRFRSAGLVLASTEPPYYPYLQSANSFPLPDNLTNPYGPTYFPQLAISSAANTTLYDLVYAVNVSGIGSVLEFSVGTYNATLAQSIYTNNSYDCPLSRCPSHLPISWNSPIPIASFGGAMVRADAIATWSDCIAVAATVSGQTSLFLGDDFGDANWTALTGQSPIAGGSPKLLMDNGTLVLTTLSPILHVVEFNNVCPAGLPNWHSSGQVHREVTSGPPAVTAVVPYQATAGTSLEINGTNLSGATAVYFGGHPGTYSYVGSQLWATPPTESIGEAAGEPVQVVTSSGDSNPSSCAAWFQYGTAIPTGSPQVESLSPTGGLSGTSVTIDGVYFGSSSSVYFGGTHASSTAYEGTGVLKATAPSGVSGTVNVTVTNSAGESLSTCGDLYDYQPAVSGLIAAGGASGNTVTIYGSYFTSSSTVKFGSTASSKVKFVSSTELKAKAPSGSGTVDVTVHQNTAASPTTCSDHFSYTTAPNASVPQILSVSPTSATSGSTVTLTGVNFTTSMLATFGLVPAYIASVNSTSAKVVVPLGDGTVPIQVISPVGASFSVCEDRFGIGLPTAPAGLFENSTALGSAVADAPVWNGTGPVAVLASNTTHGSLEYFAENATAFRFSPNYILGVNSSTGSSLFDRLGDTDLTVPDSSPGAVAAAMSGSNLFVFYTTNGNDVTSGRTLVSGNGGRSWSGPYADFPLDGSILDPQVEFGPSGYVYGSWVDAIGKAWEVDEETFAASGRVLNVASPLSVTHGSPFSNPSTDVVNGSSGSLNLGNASLSMVLDPFQRPLLAWAGSGILGPDVAYSGGFVSPKTELSVLESGLADTHYPEDFANFGWNATRTDLNSLNDSMTNLTTDLTPTTLCRALEVTTERVYPNVTHLDSSPSLGGPAIPACSPSIANGFQSYISAAEVGPLSPNVYLGVECQVLLEGLGFGTMPDPTWNWLPGNSGFGDYNLTTNSSMVVGPYGEVFTVQPVTINPNTVYLHVTNFFPRSVSDHIELTNDSGRNIDWKSRGGLLVTGNYSVSVRVPSTNSTNVSFFGGTAGPPSIYVRNLTPWENGTYKLELSFESKIAWVTSTNDGPDTLTGPGQSVSYSSPTWTFLNLTGNFTTGLSMTSSSGGLALNAGAKGSALAGHVWMQWNNTMQADAAAWLNNTATSPHHRSWSNASYSLRDLAKDGTNGEWDNVTTSSTAYSAEFVVQSRNGSTNSSHQPALNAGQTNHPSPVLTASWSCSLMENSSAIEIWSNNATRLEPTSATSANVSWYSNAPGVGWVTATESPEAGNVLASATRVKTFNGSFEFEAELHGLDAWGLYYVDVHEEVQYGCVRYQSAFLPAQEWTLQLPASFALQESDLPYDSITQEGGGQHFSWQVPYNFTQRATFRNGSVESYIPGFPSYTTVVPITSLTPAVVQNISWPGGGAATTFLLNTSEALLANTSYDVEMFLNYTEPNSLGGGNITVPAESSPYSFVYLNDTSGDGLTNSEKALGWDVNANTVYNNVSQGNPNAWATNGLVSDYVEKELGLNDTMLDSARSDMLDTWNLSFSLGLQGSTPACPAEFNCWVEPTYDPFDFRQYPGETPNGLYATNSSGNGHVRVDDSGEYDAVALWVASTGGADSTTNNALRYLQSLIMNETSPGERLRAVIGCLAGNSGCTGSTHPWTLTVWGKLSWGANPLASSTPNDGIPDGMRVNPIGATYLNVTLDGFNESTHYSATGDGGAVFINAVSSSAPDFPTGRTDYSSYSLSVNSSGTSMNWSGLFPVNFPVVPTEQQAILNFSVVDAGSGGLTWRNTASVDPDLLNQSVQTGRLCGTGFCISYSYQASTAFSKANTVLIVPGDNSTLAAAPVGLMRYSGEQDFVLLEGNVTTGGWVNTLYPYVNSSAPGSISADRYGVTMYPGMNNILVPRSLFVQSPLGQALLANRSNPTIARTTLNGAYLNASDNGTRWWDPETWEARVEGSSAWNGTNYSQGSPGLTGQPGFVRLYSNTNQTCTGGSSCGGVPSNPTIEAQEPSFAIGSLYVFNISNDQAFFGLLAGLLMTPSGNFTNWADSVTSYLPSLGLTPTVVSALANSTLYNSGAYGKPVYHPPAPSPTAWQSVGATIWNAVSGTVGHLVSVVWGAVAAAAAYITYLAGAVWAWGLSIANQTIHGLQTIANAVVWAIDQLASILMGILTTFLTTMFRAAWLVIGDGLSLMNNLGVSGENTVIAYAQGQSSLSSAAAAENLGIAPFLGVAGAIVVGIDVALGIAAPVSLSAGILAGLLLVAMNTVVGSGALQSPTSGFGGHISSVANGAADDSIDELVGSTEAAFNYTSTSFFDSSLTTGQIQPMIDPPDFVADQDLAAAASTAGGFLISFEFATSEPSSVNAQRGLLCASLGLVFSLDVAALVLLNEEGSHNLSCTYMSAPILDFMTGENIVSFITGVAGLGFGAFGLLHADDGWDALLSAIALILGGIGIYVSYKDTGSDLGCQSTAYWP